jgi:hypothetical protein
MNLKGYSFQTFFDTARRRSKEARELLDHPAGRSHTRRDAAVTCALLAAECALKCLLLHVYQASKVTALPDDVQQRAFRSRAGHSIVTLWSLLDAQGLTASAEPSVREAIDLLHGADRYLHRYGVRRPFREHAAPRIEAAEVLVEWMKGQLP